MSINAVKGVEIGNGFQAARITGEENADEMRMGEAGPEFTSNHAGGVLGGIATGQPLVARFAVKPTSSILTERRSVDVDGNEVDVRTKGRHDPVRGDQGGAGGGGDDGVRGGRSLAAASGAGGVESVWRHANAFAHEIKRLVRDQGQVPGRAQFEKETGIRTAIGMRVHWRSWGDAIEAAGFPSRTN